MDLRDYLKPFWRLFDSKSDDRDFGPDVGFAEFEIVGEIECDLHDLSSFIGGFTKFV